MAKISKYKKLNEEQECIMRNSLASEKYEWEQKYLEKLLFGKLSTEQRYFFSPYKKTLSKEETEQNQIVDEINAIIRKYNNDFSITPYNCVKKQIEDKYNELYEKHTIQPYHTNESLIKDELVFNKVYLLSGLGGMGKSQYLYEFGEKVKNKKYNYLLIYGKYLNFIEEEIFEEVIRKTKKQKFYFIIDAINEFEDSERAKLLSFVENNKENSNLRIIISYRSYSLKEKDLEKLYLLKSESIEFSGVSGYDALEKISEKYNVDLSIYENMLANNNPYQIQMILKYISDNRLLKIRRKPLEKGTYIYENMIKEALTRQEWERTKTIVKEIVLQKNKRLEVDKLKSVLLCDFENYIEKMKNTGFIKIYFSRDNKRYIAFKNESLLDYLIVRNLFEEINGDIREIILKINGILDIFPSVGHPLILMLLEKFEKHINKAVFVINNSFLRDEISLDVFNEVNLSKENQEYIYKNLDIEFGVRDCFLIAGGQHTNPFNCSNYLNEKLFKNKVIEFEYGEYEIKRLENRLKVWIRSIAKYNYDKIYIDEKFWCAFWIMSIPNGNIRFLARKLIYEILKENQEYIKKLIEIYYKTEDEYIKEGIIHVLSSLKRNQEEIINFFREINDYNMVNIENLYHISDYIERKENYMNSQKKDVIDIRDKKINYKIFDFWATVDFAFKDQYKMFGLNIYNLTPKTIHFQDEFLKYNKQEICRINTFIETIFVGCENCDAIHILRENLEILYKNISKEKILAKDIYLAWQKQFKILLKKYKIKIDDLRFRVLDERAKNNVYKALDISIANTVGSIASNYYTTKFCEYGYLGYNQYLQNFYKEKPSLYYPISVYNEKIDKINNKLLKEISIPYKKNKKWMDNYKLSLDNIKKLIEPVKQGKETWRMIYGSVKKSENLENSHHILWSDTYILNLAVDECFKLTKNPNIDRNYTIETQTICDGLENLNDYDYSQTASIKNSSNYKDFFVQTDFKVPPIKIIKLFDLNFDKYDNSWKNSKGEEIVLVNNNKGSWYADGITGSIYIKEEYFQILKEKCMLKYFCFTNRYLHSCEKTPEAALEIELFLNGREKYYKHYKKYKKTESVIQNRCQNCMIYKEMLDQEERWKNEKVNITFIGELMEEY